MSAAAIGAGMVCGCVEHERSGFGDVDPSARLRSIEEAASTDDRSSVPALIIALESDDAAERFLAIHTLERMTGQTLGYDHSAPRPERRAAAERWQAWYSSQASHADAALPSSARSGEAVQGPGR